MIVDLDKLETLARAATPGPWRQGNIERDRVFVQHEDGLGTERVLLRMNEHFAAHVADAVYIAAVSPDVVLALIERLRELHDVEATQSQRIEELADRRDELLVLVRNLSQSTPLPDELAGWEGQRAALIAEVGTLKARVRALETQRDEAQAQSNRDLELRREANAAHAETVFEYGQLLDEVRCLRARLDLTETQTSIERWRRETFGAPSTASRLAARANVEMAELLDELSAGRNDAAAVECADVAIVLFGVAERLGVDLLAEVDKKMVINRARKWTIAGDGTGKHVRERDCTCLGSCKGQDGLAPGWRCARDKAVAP